MQDLIDLLDRHKVRFLLVGGYAVNLHGYTRATQDIDFLIQPDQVNAQRLAAALTDFGFGKAGLPLADFAHEGIAVHLGVEPNRIDLVTSISGISSVEAFENSDYVDLDGRRVPVIGLAALVKSKSMSERKKDQADAEELRAILEKRTSRA